LEIMNKEREFFATPIIVTAGSSYLDIDAYACCVAMQELLKLQGENVIACSSAPCNYSVPLFLKQEGRLIQELPSDYKAESCKYIIVDVSDPNYIKDSVPLENVVAVYDHHVGFEEFWKNRIGENSHIEFIGAAATLIYREWKNAGLQDKMTRSTALLLIAAILDNTLNLTSSNTTGEDKKAFQELCEKTSVGEEWCASYFSEVQESVEADLKNAMFKDIKTITESVVLPKRIAQLCVWDSNSVLERLPEIRKWFQEDTDNWMINLIDIKNCCSYFVCDDVYHQKRIEKLFDVDFIFGVAKTTTAYLRKQIIKEAFCK